MPLPEATQNAPSFTDGSEHRRLVSVNGSIVPEATARTVGLITEDGRVLELEQTALLQLGDGTLTDRLNYGIGRCTLCAQQAAELAVENALSASQALLLGLCRSETLRCSDLSGIPLCPRHRRLVPTPNGVLTISTDEEAELKRSERRQRIKGWLLSIVVERDP